MKVKISKIEGYDQGEFKVTLPKYQTDGAAGFDLVSVSDLEIQPGETRLISIGLKFEIPKGYEMQIRPRSGLTAKSKLRVHLGTVDSDYRGEVYVIASNVSRGTDSVVIKRGSRIAQGVINKVETVEFEFSQLQATERNEDGIGSTGE